MMHLTGTADPALLSELKDLGILTPAVIDRIDAAMGRPESGSLTDFLLAGGEAIAEKPWLSWLIRGHGCHRYGIVSWQPDGESPARLEGADPNLCYRKAADLRPMVALLRPDLKGATLARLGNARPLWAAATLSEAARLRDEALRRNHA